MPDPQESIVRDLEISDGEQVHKASYFVELGMLHANIGGKIIRMSVGADTSDEAVRRLLLGHIQTREWRRRMSQKWIKRTDEHG